MKMRALVVDAEKNPKPGYVFDEYEKRTGIIRDGSKVWRNAQYNIREMDVPVPGPEEVLIKVMACGICGSDGHVYHKDEDGYIGLAWHG